jgi:DNA primase
VWKASLNKFSSQETALLDSDNGAGWDFASTLVCARELRVSLSQVQSHSFIMTNGT